MTAPRTLLPTNLLQVAKGGHYPQSTVACDTETSGLFVDEGARVSTVSVAWIDSDGYWAGVLGTEDGQHQWDGGIWTYRWEQIAPDTDPVPVVSVAWPFDQGISGTDKPEDTGQGTMWPDADNQPRHEWQALLDWLMGLPHGIVFHNAKFDIHMMYAGTRRWRGLGVDLIPNCVGDTQNGNSLLYPTDVTYLARTPDGMQEKSTTSLKPTAAWLWGEGETDEQAVIKRYLAKMKLPSGRWDLMPWDIIAKYADQDARLTIRLHLRQQHDIDTGKRGSHLVGGEGKLTANAALARRLQTTLFLTRMERAGLPFDVEGAKAASLVLKDTATRLEQALPFAPATLPMAKHYWFGEGTEKGIASLELQPYATTDKGGPQMTAQILQKMILDEIPAADTWRDLQKVRTADSRWYEGYASMVGADGRLRASVRQNGTVSSRFSVERVQLQAIPHDYRLSDFAILDEVPTPRTLIGSGVPAGYTLWELDLANAEARVAALYAKCETMLTMIKDGADLHGETAKSLFNASSSDPNWGQTRNIAKRGNFSFIFGVGAATFQESVEQQTGIRLGDAHAESIVRDWNGLYPEYRRAIKKTAMMVEARQRRHGYGWVETANGERRWFQEREESHKAFNQRVQANLAQFGLDWWLTVEDRARRKFGDDPVVAADGTFIGRVGMVMVIHDSMCLLLPTGKKGSRFVEYAQKTGVDLWERRFPGVPGGVDAKRWSSD